MADDIQVVVTEGPPVEVVVEPEPDTTVTVALSPPVQTVEVAVPGPAGPPGPQGIPGSGGGVTDHGALTGLADDDHGQYHTNARGDARYSLLGHEHDHIAPLAADSYAEADPVYDFPAGITMMHVAPSGNWGPETSISGYVVTEYDPEIDLGRQTLVYSGDGRVFERTFISGLDDWKDWHIVGLPLLDEDAYTEAEDLTTYADGVSLMPVAAAANWGPNFLEAGRVLTLRTGATGTQQFWADNGSFYWRAYSSGAWAAWQDVGAGGSGGGDLNYSYSQVLASDTWTITHSLGKHPSVTIVDSGQNIVEGDVQYIDTDSLVVTFSVAFSGAAYLN